MSRGTAVSRDVLTTQHKDIIQELFKPWYCTVVNYGFLIPLYKASIQELLNLGTVVNYGSLIPLYKAIIHDLLKCGIVVNYGFLVMHPIPRH